MFTRVFVCAALFAAAVPAVHGAPRDAVILDDDQRADDLYQQGRDAIERQQYHVAIERLDKLIALKTDRTDAAMYWRAYSMVKSGNAVAAIEAIAQLKRQFPNSRWVKDADALDVEARQSVGQVVTPESQADEDTKLMALRGIMTSDPERALPILEQMLAGTSSPKVKDRALFVLSQSDSPRARTVIANVAKGGPNPDLQLRAIRYLGVMGGDANRQILADVYRSSTDPAVKRAIIRSFMVAGDKARLVGLAKGETNVELRGEAVQQLGVMGAHAELAELYQTETSVDVKKRVLQAMFVGGSADKLIDLAKNEKDPQLRRTAVRNLGLMNAGKTGDALKAIYQSDASADVRKEAINALFLQNNGHVLVELARAEKDPQMKKELVSKMSLISKNKEVTDYLLELLK